MTARLPLADLIGRSAALDALREQIRRLARIAEDGGQPPPILLLGETGTGKGLVAGLLHRSGRRGAGPFIDVNCAAIPDALLESELFGFERGTFTDARAPKQGLIEAAHHGTLFLDEIGELPDGLQAKLLTAIESRQVRRLGSTRNETVDVWIIAATSIDLTTAMRTGHFRRELFHRLSTVVLELPPLRHRQRDVLDLADHFLARAAVEHRIPSKRLSEDARTALLEYPWPGNIRELANVLERVMLLEDSPVITAAMLSLLEPAESGGSAPECLQSPEALRADERHVLVTALNAARGNITRAAARLGIHRNTMRYRLTKHGLSPHGTTPANGAEEGGGDARPSAAPTPAAANTIRWEERLVAVLGATIAVPVGSSAFGLAGMMTELIEMVTSFGARIEQFAPSELVAVFGVEPMEDAVRRAVLASHAMLHALRRSEHDKHGRFAIHLGSYLIARAGAVTGMDAHARRQATDIVNGLLQQAGPDEIVVDAPAARFLEPYFSMESLADGPSASARIVGRERPRFEGGGRVLSRFVGRAGDVGTLHALMGRVEAGEAHIVGLVGEPGVGKSRLLFELTHAPRVAGWLVLEAAAVSHGKATSYLPVTDLLRRYFGIGDRDTPRDVREKVTGRLLTLDRALEPALPALLALLEVAVDDPRWRGLDPSGRRQQTLHAVRQLLVREAHAQPVLLVFEDLHWIDGETQALLDTLVAGLSGARLLLLTSYRPEYRQSWDSAAPFTELRLDPLSPEHADQLLDDLLGSDASLEVLKRLLRASTGRNPLFIEEGVRSLVETGGLAGERGAYRMAQPVDRVRVPATVQAILAARIDRLSDEDKRLLETAAVIGPAVPLNLLRVVAEQSEEELHARLKQLQTAEFLFETRPVPDLEYAFKHALTHEVVYAGVLEERRCALHARIAESIERLYTDRLTEHVERLAHHTLEGKVWDLAVRYLRQAGTKAAARHSLREAVAWFDQALGALSHLPHTRATLELAAEIRFARQPSVHLLGDYRLAQEYLLDLESLAERLGDDHYRCRACRTKANICNHSGNLDEAVAYGTRALEIAQKLGDLSLRIAAVNNLEQTYFLRGEYQTAIDLAKSNLAALPNELYGGGNAPAASDRGWLVRSLAELGRFAEAAEPAEAEIRIAELLQRPYVIGWACYCAGNLHNWKGQWDAARALYERAITAFREGGVVTTLGNVTATSAWVLAHLGESTLALTRAHEAARLLELARAQRRTAGNSWSYFWLGQAYLRLGWVPDAENMVPRVLEPRTTAAEAHASYLEGEIALHPDRAQPGRAEDAYRRALRLADGCGMRPLVARCHVGLARLYGHRGQPEQAQGQSATALAMFRGMDGGDEQRADSLLASLSS